MYFSRRWDTVNVMQNCDIDTMTYFIGQATYGNATLADTHCVSWVVVSHALYTMQSSRISRVNAALRWNERCTTSSFDLVTLDGPSSRTGDWMVRKTLKRIPNRWLWMQRMRKECRNQSVHEFRFCSIWINANSIRHMTWWTYKNID